jgi:VWFA-related protein
MPRSVLSLALALGWLTLSAQDQPVQPFRGEANYIRVDMYPTLGGRPVEDLQATEVEIADQGVPQKIDRFVRIRRQGAQPQQAARVEPATVTTAAPAAGSPGRIFVLFLDSNHVDGNWAKGISQPLIRALNTLIREDDLIAVMTADTDPRNLTFTSRTTSIEDVLQRNWGRGRRIDLTPEEAEFAACYPGNPLSRVDPESVGIAQEMILRRREQRTLDALDALVDRLGTIEREERKAVITISYGWRLFEGDEGLRPSAGPGAQSSGIDRDRGVDLRQPSGSVRATPRCESARASLSMMRSDSRFQEILNRANRANTTFYPIDPRGTTVFDEDIVPAAGVGVNASISLKEDGARQRERRSSLLTMAEETDGLAVVNTNGIAAGLQRINDDLSSYYLVGFYSTQKPDGKFHKLTVRVTRKGVTARARRGYLASTTARSAPAKP